MKAEYETPNKLRRACRKLNATQCYMVQCKTEYDRAQQSKNRKQQSKTDCNTIQNGPLLFVYQYLTNSLITERIIAAICRCFCPCGLK